MEPHGRSVRPATACGVTEALTGFLQFLTRPECDDGSVSCAFPESCSRLGQLRRRVFRPHALSESHLGSTPFPAQAADCVSLCVCVCVWGWEQLSF